MDAEAAAERGGGRAAERHAEQCEWILWDHLLYVIVGVWMAHPIWSKELRSPSFHTAAEALEIIRQRGKHFDLAIHPSRPLPPVDHRVVATRF
jgi:hypothetical protein